MVIKELCVLAFIIKQIDFRFKALKIIEFLVIGLEIIVKRLNVIMVE